MNTNIHNNKNLFEDNLIDWIESNGLFGGNDRILLAVSGGADSVAMAHALAELKKQGRLSCEFVIGHVNHCLRGADSDADEAFVRRLAESLAVPVVTQAVDVKAYTKEHKLSIETAGRNLRLKTLAAMAKENACDRIAAAHHKDDLAETMIHRLMRGTGFRGLCGIRPILHVHDAIFIRPLLDFRRSEIIEYCRRNGLAWREDASNANVDFTRNRIRHLLMPWLNDRLAGTAHPTGDIVTLLVGLSYKCRQLLTQTETQAQLFLNRGHFDEANDEFTIKRDVLENCPPWVFYEVVRKVLVMLGAGLRNYTQEHFQTIYGLMGQKHAEVSMPGMVRVYAKKGILGFYNQAKPLCLPPGPVTLAIGQTVEFGPWRISCQLLDCEDADVKRFLKTKDNFVEWFDVDKIAGPLIVRQRQEGDRFQPIGAKGEKKVARFLQDGQFDAKTRETAFVIEDIEKILWVVPVRMSERAKITPKSRHLLEVCISERT